MLHSLGYFNGACDHFTQVDGEDKCGKYTNGGHTTDLWNTDEVCEFHEQFPLS